MALFPKRSRAVLAGLGLLALLAGTGAWIGLTREVKRALAASPRNAGAAPVEPGARAGTADRALGRRGGGGGGRRAGAHHRRRVRGAG